MKKIYYLYLSWSLLFVIAVQSYSQVTNLVVNGSSTNFTMTSGDTVTWQFNLPTGATADAVLWGDVNANGTIETNVDIKYLPFSISDGNQQGYDGPPDMDETVNGQIYFNMAVGLAPGHWIFEASHNSVGQSVFFEVLHLASPAHIISGHITPPSGLSAKNILIGIEPQQGEKTFWHAITDSLGDYHIEMTDTSGNPWKIRLVREYNPFPGYVLTPEEYEVIITGNHSGFDFAYVGAAAKIVGYLKDDGGNALPNFGMWLGRHNDTVNFDRDFTTDDSGYFQVGLAANELSNDNYQLGSSFDNESETHEYLAANVIIPGIHTNDSLFYDITAYRVNSTIQGQVRINGNPPGFPIQISGIVQDTAWTSAWADSLTGNFSLEVSNKLYNYDLWPNNLPQNHYPSSVTAHPGQTGVIINITVNGISEREPGVPSLFSLGQNYPNPFNPTTVIDYDLPQASLVQLTVYNILGEEVMKILHQEQAPGKYRATIDASQLSSGIYFYRLSAGAYSEMKKMMILK
ncbi:MAG: T9SS type A sorting domain-containing protein [Bacteroidetes bacterium]|nr:MAG: T9SS type A sorting domain-containing protein [Bacteroidota bacterium]